jgi:hypothetical protein
MVTGAREPATRRSLTPPNAHEREAARRQDYTVGASSVLEACSSFEKACVDRGVYMLRVGYGNEEALKFNIATAAQTSC